MSFRLRTAAAVAVGVGICALAGPVAASSDRAPRGAASTTAAAADPLGVYFRPDAVGRSQLALVVSACGTERWTVKTGTDDDRHQVKAALHDVSVNYLRHRASPGVRPQTGRAAPVEETTYRVRARITDYVREDDGDYHLVLTDRAGRTMVAEIPDPACVGRISPFRAAIRAARTRMDAHFSVTSDFKAADQRVTVRGIGFFDYFHGQTGMAPNDLELHPVTGLRLR